MKIEVVLRITAEVLLMTFFQVMVVAIGVGIALSCTNILASIGTMCLSLLFAFNMFPPSTWRRHITRWGQELNGNDKN